MKRHSKDDSFLANQLYIFRICAVSQQMCSHVLWTFFTWNMFWGDPQCPADYGVTEQVLWSRLWLLQLLSRLEAPFKCLPVFVVLRVSCVVGRGLSCGFLKLSHLVGIAYGIQAIPRHCHCGRFGSWHSWRVAGWLLSQGSGGSIVQNDQRKLCRNPKGDPHL